MSALLGMNVFADALGFIRDNPHLLLDRALEQLRLSLAALAVSVALALPLGAWLGHRHRGSVVAINTANVGRALPTLAVLALGIVVLGLGVGFKTNLLALVVLGVPPILTNAYVAVDRVDPEPVGAARGMGMTGGQVLTRVELPLALPTIFAGIRVAAIFIIATATIAGAVGGGSLGAIIVNQASFGLDGVLGAAMCVALLALLVDLILAIAQRLLTPRGLRGRTAQPTYDTPIGTLADAGAR